MTCILPVSTDSTINTLPIWSRICSMEGLQEGDNHDDVIKWKHFFALLALCVGNSPFAGEFPSQRPVTWSCDVFFDMYLNKRSSKQSWVWWFETPLRSFWRHCIEYHKVSTYHKPVQLRCRYAFALQSYCISYVCDSVERLVLSNQVHFEHGTVCN